MKMAHVMAGAPAGGAELFFERLTTALHRAGDDVLPIIRRNPARAARLHAARLHAARLHGSGLGPIELPFGGLFDLRTRPAIRRHLRAFAPRLVMAWMSRAAAFTPRGDYVLTGRLGGYYDLRRFQHCDHLVANTGGLVNWITAQGWAAARVHHLPNFAPDLAGVAPAVLPVPPGSPTVLAMGRLHRNKAFDVLIRTMARLPAAHAVIAGDGPERDSLRDIARAEGVADRVHLLGWRSDQAALLAACTVLCCPSRQEPLGNVVLEAFSARRPVVAASAPGPRELIRPGETGLLAPVEDAEALAEALAAVIEDQGLSARLALAGRTEFDAVHAEAPVIARWQALLATLEPA